jgi:ketosteroid isomerase-like protein
MSQENVEIVRLAYERINRGDIEGFVELCTTDLEFRDLPELPGSGLHIGHDALRAWWAQVLDAFDELRFEAVEFIDAGGDRVVLVIRAMGRGRGSGAKVELDASNVATLRDGKISKHFSYSDHADALEAAGLSE